MDEETPRPIEGDPSAEQVGRMIDMAREEWWLIDGDYSMAAAETMSNDGSNFKRVVLVGLPFRRNKGTERRDMSVIIDLESAVRFAENLVHVFQWIASAEEAGGGDFFKVSGIDLEKSDLFGYPANVTKLMAAVDVVRRTGAIAIDLRYQDDRAPVVWLTVAEYLMLDGFPVPKGTEGAADRWETAAGHDALDATLRLCERLIDGGECQHCHRLSGFFDGLPPIDTPDVCFTFWDAEAERFRRSCEESS